MRKGKEDIARERFIKVSIEREIERDGREARAVPDVTRTRDDIASAPRATTKPTTRARLTITTTLLLNTKY